MQKKRIKGSDFVKVIALAGIVLFAACSNGQGEENSPTEAAKKPVATVTVPAGQREADGELSGNGETNGTVDELKPPTLLPAKSEIVIAPGNAVEGVFDESREIIRVSCEREDDGQAVYVDGEKVLTLSADKVVQLYDIDEMDAFLELFVGEQVEHRDGVSLEGKAYRVHPGKLTEIVQFPVRDDNAPIVIPIWNKGKGGVSSGGDWYWLNPVGYLVRDEESPSERVIPITVDGEVHQIPLNYISIKKDCNLAIAFERYESIALTEYHRVFRSLDGGLTWTLATKDVKMAAADMEYIYILDESTVIACWDISGVTWMRSSLISEDGGLTWSYVDEKKYWFLNLPEKDYSNW